MAHASGAHIPVSPADEATPRLLSAVPLVVDLDDTLVRTDLLIESILSILRTSPWRLLSLPFWMARGTAWLKQQTAARTSLDVSILPWNTQLIEYLASQRAQGRSLILATASDERLARQVADHLGLFDAVFASNGADNLSGDSKRDLLVRRFGDRGFDYAADGGGLRHSDLAIWASARRSILVNPARSVSAEATRTSTVERIFGKQKPPAALWLNPLRPAHWLKNLLVLVPVLAAQRVPVDGLLLKSLLAFVAFGCCASSGYLFNDLIDLDADRHHPHKRLRPFAAGDLPLSYALGMIPLLLLLGCLLGMLASPALFAVLLLYFLMSALYTLRIKKLVILDVLFLAGLYTVRILAGSAATGIWPSHWLLAFSTFLFFSLALVKRYGELVVMRQANGNSAAARAYQLSDGELLAAMGVASGYLAVLVMALYIATEKAHTLYSTRQLLWLECPLLLYWISFVWLTAHRGHMPDDPVVFAIGDRTSRILIVLMLIAALAAV